MPQRTKLLPKPTKVGASVAEHGGRVPGRREAPVALRMTRLVLPGGGSSGGVVGGAVGVHGLLGAVEVGLEADAVGEVGEGRGAQHHDARPDRVLPRPPAAPHLCLSWVDATMGRQATCRFTLLVLA